MKVVIDRFENDYAVCEKEDGEFLEIHREKIPQNAKEGDVLKFNKDEIVIDYDETRRRKEEIKKKAEDLWI